MKAFSCLRVCIEVSLLVIPTACVLPNTSTLAGLVDSSRAPNIAVLISDKSNLEGPETDITNMTKFLGSMEHQYNFHIIAARQATKQQILDSTVSALSQVGQSGTLLWYFSGHGKIGMVLPTEDTPLSYQELANAIHRVRKTPVRRVIVVIDACHSGSILQSGVGFPLQETKAGPNSVALQSALATVVSSDNRPMFEQIIVITATDRDELAQDLGTTEGGQFTSSFLDVFQELYSQHQLDPGSSVQIGDLLRKTQSRTRSRSEGVHTPVYVASPEYVYSTALFDTSGAAENTLANQGTPNTRGKSLPADEAAAEGTAPTLTVPSDPDRDDDQDGVSNGRDLCLRTQAGAQVSISLQDRDWQGCAKGERRNLDYGAAYQSLFADTDGDGVVNWADHCKDSDGKSFNVWNKKIHTTDTGASKGYLGCAESEIPQR